MTVQIPKSQTWPEFELEVAHFAEAMRDWRAHMKRVQEDEDNAVRGIDKHVAYPRPIAPDLVDQAVDEDGKPDYQIIDDGPTPEQVLAYRKNQLIGQVTNAESAAIAAVVPPAKARWLNIREREIRSKDSAVVADIFKKNSGLISSVKKIADLGPLSGEAISKAVNAKRSDDDQKLLAGVKEAQAKIASIQRSAAKAHADIEDLTLETIDAWKLPDFTA